MRLKTLCFAGLFSTFALSLPAPALADELAEGFKNPPSSARPRVWWHWMNGNVTIDGIEKDLAWMEKIGIGGLQNFDASLNTPQVVDKRLVYMDPDWKVAFKRAVELADEKGLEFAIASSPGWSDTGGPWVKPGDGMKKLVWSETIVPGGKRFIGKLAPAPTTTGPFGDVKPFDPIAMMTGGPQKEPPQAGGPVAVMAVSVAAQPLPVPTMTAHDGSSVPAETVLDASLESAFALKPNGEQVRSVLLDYGKPVTVRSARLFFAQAKFPFTDPVYTLILEAEQGGSWSKIAEMQLGEGPTTVTFQPVTAQRFRIVLGPFTGLKRVGLNGSAPGAEEFSISQISRALTARPMNLAELRLSNEARIGHAEEKAGYGAPLNYHDMAGLGTAPSGVKAIDLTARVKDDGSLDWTPPKGSDWRIYRFGWSLTGKTNHPATAEATGLEVDKYDADAVRRYLEHYLGLYRDVVGPEMIGKRGIRALLTDSIEVGFSNWTPTLPAEFKARRGYDMMPFLPALAGEVIRSEAESEKFLYDFRTTLAELLADAHYGTVAEVAHENDLKVYGEALEDTRPTLGDDLQMRKYADVPMAALWTWNRDGAPRPTLLGDMKGAASVAHLYGQNIVAAESMTSAAAPWAFAPHDLKRIIDVEFASGINRPVVHTSVHQPLDDKQPGFSLMIFGQYFNRHDTWASMAKPWVDYMARTGFMLQQGRNYADIAWFYGEESPLTALHAYGKPEGLPKGYAYDFVNADVLANVLSVEGKELVAKSGARYKALYLGGTSNVMTLATLKRIAAFADSGVPVIGMKPERSPRLKDDAAEFAALADRVWANANVHALRDPDAAMTKLGIAPDFAFEGGQKDSEILFAHRKLADGDVYFVNNRKNEPTKLWGNFRVSGKQAEIWRAVDGKTQLVSYNMVGDTTSVPLNLGAEDAVFVVFRKPSSLGGVSGLELTSVDQRPKVTLAAPWTVGFQPGRGAPASATMKALAPLNESTDPGIKYFSGIATYTTSFPLPKGAKAGAPVLLDLGKVGDVAEVRVNGKDAGIVWFSPWQVDIGPFLKSGSNTLEIRVANTWVNRLIGDKQPGAAKITFTHAPTYRPDAPLRPSGLIGPVTLIVQ